MELNDKKATAILVEGTNRQLYESGGSLPTDEKIRLRDATELVEAAELAFKNGNKSDNVNTVLYIAQCDMKPIIPELDISAQNPPEEEIVANGKTINKSTGEIIDNTYNGLDLSTLADGVLDALITGLDNYPQNEKVEEDRRAYVGEKERRTNAKGQEVPQAAEGSPTEEKAGEIAPEGTTPANEGTGQRSEEIEGPNS